MSLEIAGVGDDLIGFPRVSGDEPAHPIKERPAVEFSPRERG